MNISQIFSSQANLSDLPKLNENISHHARILESKNLDLNLSKEHEKMILIAGRLYRLENPKNYNLPEDVIAKIIPSTNGKLGLLLSSSPAESKPQAQENTYIFPGKEFWQHAKTMDRGLTSNDIRGLLRALALDNWPLLLKGVLRDNGLKDDDYTKLLEHWVLKSKANRDDGFSTRFFQLPFLLDDKYELIDVIYHKGLSPKKVHKLILKFDKGDAEVVCSILLVEENMFVNFFSRQGFSKQQKSKLQKKLTTALPGVDINFYNKRFVDNKTPTINKYIDEYG